MSCRNNSPLELIMVFNNYKLQHYRNGSYATWLMVMSVAAADMGRLMMAEKTSGAYHVKNDAPILQQTISKL